VTKLIVAFRNFANAPKSRPVMITDVVNGGMGPQRSLEQDTKKRRKLKYMTEQWRATFKEVHKIHFTSIV
jgi:hypothetical protein